ncbi:hypothetical protein M9458_048047, partial [Cirrhinus mrigala]
VEKDLAKLAEQGKLNRSPNSPHRSLLLTPLFHTTNTLPVLGQTSLSTKTTGLPLHNTKPTSLVMGRTSPSNPSSRAQTPSGARTPSRPLTPNSLMMHSTCVWALKEQTCHADGTDNQTDPHTARPEHYRFIWRSMEHTDR